jgi:hypothetical protein
MLSVLALQEIVTVVDVMPEATKLVGTLGGVVSVGGRVVALTGDDWAELLPAWS